MNEDHRDTDMHSEASSTIDVLIARIVDHAADESDWQVFSSLASGAQGAGAWRRLAECQRDAALLNARVDDVTRCANTVGLFDHRHAPVARVHEGASPERGEHRHRRSNLPRYAGWAVAASLAFAWMATAFNIGPLTACAIPSR